MTAKMKRAIVIGGGFGGLLAARVLSDFYREVYIFEKDELPDGPDERPGTPQAYHPHRFTFRGKEITNHFFPGFEEDLILKGAPSSLNKTVHQQNKYGAIVLKYPRNDIKFSRQMLEWVIRERVKKIPNICFFPAHQVTGLLFSEEKHVLGVAVRNRKTQDELTYTADLTADTSGRTSKTEKWLTEHGFDVPCPDVLTIKLGYSTRRYKLPSHRRELADQLDVINLAGDPENGTMTGVFSFIENQIAELALGRPGGNYPPYETGEFEQALKDLSSPIIADTVKDLEPITPPKSFRIPEIIRHHYEDIANWPSGLLVLGDAICTFDPIFGQGMTVAAMEAETLERFLISEKMQPEPYLERRLLFAFQKNISPAWWLNCAADLQWKNVEYKSDRPLKGIDFVQKFMDFLLKFTTEQKKFDLYGLYWAVNTLSVPSSKLFNENVVTSVLESSSEGIELLEELRGAYHQPVDKILAEIVSLISGDIPIYRAQDLVK
ncbi:NAD(P)/FAD-dependent oxidoreductase [Metabacillus sp. RGM 3146]|uniref:NAD(P)/FAD-dependent oxidoreductase n=1 Tax=Metabacillus sp. RGM 3146 TaxID=3401092 RepID=UPI003B9A8977